MKIMNDNELDIVTIFLALKSVKYTSNDGYLFKYNNEVLDLDAVVTKYQ